MISKQFKLMVLWLIKNLFPAFMFKIKKKKIVVSSFRGNSFSGNPKIVVEKLLSLSRKKNLDLDIVWLTLDEKGEDLPEGVRGIRYNSLKSLIEMASAQVWVDDFRKKYFPPKKKSQIYYQLWHGCIPLKMIEKDSVDSLTDEYVSEAKADSKIADYMVSGNTFTENIYRNSFWFSGEILKYGTPKIDYLVSNVNEQRLSHDKLGTNYILYCPTFRDKFQLKDYILDSKKILAKVSKELGGHWKLLIRLHPNIRDHEKEVVDACPGSVGVTDYPSLDTLILKSQIVITDYSSVMFDALYANKPVILYLKEQENYDRNLYFQVDELPFVICHDNEEISDCCSKIFKNEYENKYELFLDKIGNYESGKAGLKLAKHIVNQIGEL
ncbi:hypothetical protein LPAF129_20070 [Ligilactobacillus pabuli]|uniref:Uncharacterized protein n=1 Tax=Ligilactobacillus pabuli TaxID=2886039 RepID=A0ABQ5JK43_9LACO|nr:CDP-glycerol glycerophosphotransferase family protein [Ligilactobacillus pabuli]GKS82321.1 hypothetical protein LPAF129_20070 [Ligilactobacillus pabuli]